MNLAAKLNVNQDIGSERREKGVVRDRGRDKRAETERSTLRGRGTVQAMEQRGNRDGDRDGHAETEAEPDTEARTRRESDGEE